MEMLVAVYQQVFATVVTVFVLIFSLSKSMEQMDNVGSRQVYIL